MNGRREEETEKVGESLAQLREDLTRSLLLAFAVLAVPALAASVFRAQVLGWQPIMGAHVIMTALLWITVLLRPQLPASAPALVILLIFYVAGILGVARFGLEAGATPLLVTGPILGQLLLGYPIALALLGVTLGVLLIAGYLLSQGALFLVAPPELYRALPVAWLNYAAVTLLAVLALVIGLRNFWTRLSQQEEARLAAERALRHSHRQLEQRVTERTESLVAVQSTLERVMELAQLGTWSLDREDLRVTWSGAALSIIGAKPGLAEHSLEPLLGALPPDAAQELEARIEETLRGGGAFEFGSWLRREPAEADVYVHVGGEIRDGGRQLLAFLRDDTERERARRELERERARLQEIIEGTRSGTWEWNIETGETIFNERWANMVGYALEELEPTTIDTWMSLAHPEDLKESARLLERNFAGELSYYECACRIRHRDGRWIWVLDRGKVVERAEDGTPLRMSGTHSDITQQKRLQGDLEEQKKLHEAMGKIAQIGAWSYDLESQRLDWSAQTRRLHEVGDDFTPTSEAAIGFYHPDDRDRIQQVLENTIRTGNPYELEARLLTARGREITIRTIGERIPQPDGTLRLVGTIQDVSRQRLLEADLKRLARTDSLTGLANRAEFERRVEEALKLAQRQSSAMAIMILDLNRFKPINDRYGHPVGDRVLVWITERWQAQIRGHDVLARIGGDEFAVLALDARQPQDTELLAARLQQAITGCAAALELEMGPTVAIGIARYPEDGADREDLIRAADHRMYAAKRASRS